MSFLDKTTDKLFKELRETVSVTDYVDQNSAELLNVNLAEYLDQLLTVHEMNKAAAIKGSNIQEVYAYQIFKGQKNPSRDKLLCLCFGMKLTLEEIQRVLKIAGLSELYARNKRDAIIIFCINKEANLIDTNVMLDEMNEFILC